MTETVKQAVPRLLDAHPTRVRPLGGAAFAVTLESGEQLVAKRGEGPGSAPAEAAGLRWLGEHDDVPMPAVHAHDAEWLITDHVPAGGATVEAAEEFGAGLARLHLRGAPDFGSPPPGGPSNAWIGLAAMRNEPHEDWASFYAADRILPYLRTAVDQGQFDSTQAAVFERVCELLPELSSRAESPARLHGDAWSGNVHWAADGHAWLIDPAAHGGHRETDLAMLRLFGLPLLEHVLEAYAGAAERAGVPLADGVADRVGLHQIHPLLVHTVLFGGGYATQALAAARSARALCET